MNQTHNSANSGRHLVEVLAYRNGPEDAATQAAGAAGSGVSENERAAWMLLASTVMNSDEMLNK